MKFVNFTYNGSQIYAIAEAILYQNEPLTNQNLPKYKKIKVTLNVYLTCSY